MLGRLKAEPRASTHAVLALLAALIRPARGASGLRPRDLDAKAEEISMLRIVDVIQTLIRQVRPLADAVGRKDPDLAKQLRRALSSALLNTGEASGQRGARRTNHYCIALGSAEESLLALRAAEAWGYIGPIPKEVVDDFARVIGTLVKVGR